MIFQNDQEAIAAIKANLKINHEFVEMRESSNELKALVNGDDFIEELIEKIENIESDKKALARKKYSRSIKDLFERLFQPIDNIYYATNDGSVGTKGLVTDVMKDLYTNISYDHVVAIGPLIMMKFVVKMNKEYNLSTDVSLNPIMIDGTGMCGNCRVSIGSKTFFACIDGPDFPGEEVDFDELLARQSYYKDEEHECNLRLVRK